MSRDPVELLEHKVSSVCSWSLDGKTDYCVWEKTISVIGLSVYEILFQLAKVEK